MPTTSGRILQAATAAFGTRGYEATSLDALARELGVRKQTILYHYGSKEELLSAVIDQGVADLTFALEGAVASGPDRRGFELRFTTRAELQDLIARAREAGLPLTG